jgi:hypothetical protein
MAGADYHISAFDLVPSNDFIQKGEPSLSPFTYY